MNLTTITVLIYQQRAEKKCGLPCHFHPFLCHSALSYFIFTDTLHYNNTSQAASPPSWLELERISICVCLFVNRLSFFIRTSVISQIHISSLLEVQQNYKLESSVSFCFQLRLVHSRDGSGPSLSRQL